MATNEKHLNTQAERLKKLIEANQVLAQVERLDDLLPRLLNLAQEVTHSQGASILLYNEESDTLEFKLAMNESEDAAATILKRRFELKMGEGIAGHVAQSREPMIVRDAQTDERFSGKADKMTGFQTKSLVCVPVMHKEKLLGVVQVLNPKDKDFFDADDVTILESFAHLGAVALVRSKLLEAHIQQERMQVQLDAAARIQSHFLPRLPSLTSGSNIWAVTKPAIFVGGDFYDCITMPDGSLIVCVADVSGKGLPAALVGATMLSSMRSLAARELSPKEILEHLNDSLQDFLASELFATIILGRFWPDTGKTIFTAAGHYSPALRVGNTVTYLEKIPGPPIGVVPGITYSELEITLEPGSSFVLFSDGVSEARDPELAFYGDDRILDVLAEPESLPLGPYLLEDVEQWIGSGQANDDITILEVWRENTD